MKTASARWIIIACLWASPAFAFQGSSISKLKVAWSKVDVPSSTCRMSDGDADSPQSRQSVVSAWATAAVFGSAILEVRPQPALSAVKRIKGGGPWVTLDSGAQYKEMTIGDGATPHKGDRVAIHYSLFYGGLEVESSRDSQGLAARPLGFNFGTSTGPGSIPVGLQQCIEGMKVGGRRKIVLPPALAFGKTGRPPFIPGDATVQFDISLWSVKPAGVNPNLTLPGSQSIF